MYLDLFAIHVHCSCSYVVEAVTKLCKVMAYNAPFTCGMIKYPHTNLTGIYCHCTNPFQAAIGLIADWHNGS